MKKVITIGVVTTVLFFQLLTHIYAPESILAPPQVTEAHTTSQIAAIASDDQSAPPLIQRLAVVLFAFFVGAIVGWLLVWLLKLMHRHFEKPRSRHVWTEKELENDKKLITRQIIMTDEELENDNRPVVGSHNIFTGAIYQTRDGQRVQLYGSRLSPNKTLACRFLDKDVEEQYWDSDGTFETGKKHRLDLVGEFYYEFRYFD